MWCMEGAELSLLGAARQKMGSSIAQSELIGENVEKE